jgi:Flp pilus assembly protein TadD
VSAARRAVILDPLNFQVHRTAGIAFLLVREYSDAIAAFRTAISLQPEWVPNYALLGQPQYLLGDFEAARASCEVARAHEMGQTCLAVVYRKLGKQTDAEAMLQRVKLRTTSHAYTHSGATSRRPFTGSRPPCACEIRDSLN